ncbi:hypothetical protein Tco_1568972, partial [Tanacetum coccineum]
MTETLFVDSGLTVLVFSPGDDPIACLNNAMAFLTVVASSRFPTTNNQLRTSSNPRNQATIQDGRVTGHMAPFRPALSLRDKGNAAMIQEFQHSQAQTDSVPNFETYVPHSETYLNDMENQGVHAMQDFEQPRAVDFTDSKIHSDSNIILYSQYLQETQQEKLELKEQVDSLDESKENEDKYMENKIDLEKKIKELDNILFKVGQSAQTVHMLTKPQAFYDNIHKQALGYQNPFYLRKAQRIKPTLYDGIVISDKHVAMPVIDDEETLILEEESRSKMSKKEKDPEAIKQNISHKPIDYEKLNRLSDDFGKRFTPQQELSAEQAFWLRMSNPTSKPSDASPVKIEAPKELPKVSLVNESLKKLKFHLARDLINEIMEVQTVFDQMDADVQQSSVNKQCLEIAKKELLLENDRILQQIMSQDVLLTMMNSMSLLGEFVNMDGKRKESSQLQDKDSTICKLKDIIKSMREKSKEENVKYDYCEIETKNVFKDKFDTIKKTRLRTKENSDSLIDKLNLKSAENEDLKAQIQDKVFVITSLKNDLRKLKGKEIVNIAAQTPSAHTIVPGMFKLNLEPLALRLFQKEIHIEYLKYTQEQADILRGIVKQAKAKQPLDKELDFACKHAQLIQELLVYVRDTCPNAINLSAKKVVVTPKNKVKKVRFVEPLTSSSNIKQVESSKTSDSNTPVLSSTGLKCSTSNCGSKPTINKKIDWISRTPSRNMQNKVEAQPRKVNTKNSVVEPIRDVDVKHSLLNENYEPICATCKKSMFDGVHDMCLLDFV